MKKLFTLFAVLAMFAMAGCESLGDDNITEETYSINGAIQKGPFIQGSNITIQPLNENLKPIGQMYTTQTTNDAGMFEMDGVNSKYAEIIATGYYYDEVEGKISASSLTLRSIADLKDGTQTNVNLLTSLTYNRIKNLVTNEGKGISEAQEQAEKELYTALGIPAELQPNVSCGAMNIANNGEGDGLLLALSAILQEGRSVGELSEYISKFAADLADDGRVEQALLDKFNLDGQHLLRFEGRIKENLEARYKSLGIECNVSEFSQYLPYLSTSQEPHYIIPFTYYEDKMEALPDNPQWAMNLQGIEEGFLFGSDVEYLGYGYNKGYGEIYLSAAPTVINACRCDVLRTIDIPEGVTTIGTNAFNNNQAVERIGIPDSVTEIGDYAFGYCLSLASVTIPDSVTSIGEGTFIDCESLESITIPDSVTSIGLGAFQLCLSLTSIVIPDSVTDFGDWMFHSCTSLENVTLSNGLTAINTGTFTGCTNLKNITFPEGVTSIGDYAFADCEILASVTIPDSVTSIGVGAFEGCSSLVTVNIENGLSLLFGTSAFADCSSLENITIPESVDYINPYVFYGCTNLKSIHIPEWVNTIGEYAFANCIGLENISFHERSNLSYIGQYAFENCVSLASISIPEGITEIKNSTFSNCDALSSIVIPNSVTTIGKWAFDHCDNLANVFIPDSVASIGSAAFLMCVSLSSINIPSRLTSIEDFVFAYCYKLYLANITIPEGVTSIGEHAFHCSSLTSITFPQSVTSIGKGAFRFCEPLNEIYCKCTTPPFGGPEMFVRLDDLSERKIYVPTESVDAYKKASYWSEYADYIEPYQF